MSAKKLVSDYLKAVFVDRDLSEAEKYWSGDMIQHNPAMPNGLDVLRDFITRAESFPTYEMGLIMESGDHVMVHGKYSGWAGKTMIAVDIFRLENGKVVEHWDVMQEEVPASQSINGNSMFPVG